MLKPVIRRVPIFQFNAYRILLSRSYSVQNSPHYGTGIQIWDELIQPTGQMVELTTRSKNILTWYACGPTVYDSAHIGHASSYVRLDIIRRIMEHQGLSVLQVMGVTDIDDKIISRSNLRNIPWTHLAQKYELEFFRDLRHLNVKMPDVKARVSEFIPQIINFVSYLLSSTTQLAYSTSDGSVYFDTKKYGNYGIFRECKGSEILADTDTTNRDQGKGKRSPEDFALWKGVKPGEPYWNTPWGKGRPGWHIECSVMATYFFGRSVDVHSGGMDLTFPHHENEEAQCCGRFGQQKWVSHWIHTGHLHLTGDVKMSKSIGNTVSIEEFLSKKSPNILRMLCLMKKYHTNIDFNSETEYHSASLLQKLNTFISDSKAILLGTKKIRLKVGVSVPELWSSLERTKQKIEKLLLNNFDTPSTILALTDLVGEFNRNVEIEVEDWKFSEGMDLGVVLASLKTVQDYLTLFGFSCEGEMQTLSGDSSQQLLEPLLARTIDFRRQVRNFSRATDEEDKNVRQQKIEERKELMTACDNFRTKLEALGIQIKDHGKESSWSIQANTNLLKGKQ